MRIDETKLSETIALCDDMLDEMIEKHESNHFKNALRFLMLDLKMYMILSMAGLAFTMFWIAMFGSQDLSILSAYYVFLLMLSIYHQFRIQDLGMKDMVECCHLNAGRIFCYQSLAIASIQTMILFVSYVVLSFFVQVSIVQILLCVFIPLCFSQAVLLFFVNHLRHIIVAMGLGVLIYVGVLFTLINLTIEPIWIYRLSIIATGFYGAGIYQRITCRKELLWN